MKMAFERKFESIYKGLAADLRKASVVETKKWQGTNGNPYALSMREMQYVHFEYRLHGIIMEHYRQEIKPNLPWADDHFIKERIGGQPFNPGTTWKNWPYSQSAAEHVQEQFSHSYAERIWPKYAGLTSDGEIKDVINDLTPNQGLRKPLGDLLTLVQVLREDPFTRQAYLPIWFPEDLTAANQSERVPCTLGYHIMRRGDNISIFYPMRSMDFVRHFRDDVYLAIRLLIWVLQALQYKDPDTWRKVCPGKLVMSVSSLHCFSTDKI